MRARFKQRVYTICDQLLSRLPFYLGKAWCQRKKRKGALVGLHQQFGDVIRPLKVRWDDNDYTGGMVEITFRVGSMLIGSDFKLQLAEDGTWRVLWSEPDCTQLALTSQQLAQVRDAFEAVEEKIHEITGYKLNLAVRPLRQSA